MSILLVFLIEKTNTVVDRKSALASGETLLTLLGNGDADTLLTWEGNQSLLAATNDKNVGQTGGENGTSGILKINVRFFIDQSQLFV